MTRQDPTLFSLFFDSFPYWVDFFLCRICNFYVHIEEKLPLALMGVLAPGSEHA
jgi:hypothetical protein